MSDTIRANRWPRRGTPLFAALAVAAVVAWAPRAEAILCADMGCTDDDESTCETAGNYWGYWDYDVDLQYSINPCCCTTELADYDEVDAGPDCDDGDVHAQLGTAPNDDAADCMRDEDGDNWGDAAPLEPMVTPGSDCDDAEAMTFPGAAPEDHPNQCMADLDDDDWGDLVAPPGGNAGTDCDDDDEYTFPGAAPEDDNSDCMRDFDEDGWGDDSPTEAGVTPGTDCDDTYDFTYPGAPELCDLEDNNCDGDTSEETDDDTDGYAECAGDCDDADPTRNPGMTEAECDGVDTDCDGFEHEYETDDDGDGVTECGLDGLLGTADDDCDDDQPTMFPGHVEEECDGLDNDCDGDLHEYETDGDVDGVTDCGPDEIHGTADDDCDDDNAEVYPAHAEVACDGLDNDCDGVQHTDEQDNDADGQTECAGD